MSKSTIWRCPNCETLNKGDVCFMCGEKRTAHNITANYDILQSTTNSNENKMHNEVSKAKPKSKHKKHKSIFENFLLTFVLILLLFALACLCYLYFHSKSDTSEKNVIAPTVNNNLDIMNANAQFIYKSALDYCVTCTSYGSKVPDGIYCSVLKKKKSNFIYDGTFEDMKNYFNSEIGQDTTQYYCVTVKNGLPDTAFWGMEPLDDIVESITQDKIIEDNLIVGIYPPYNQADENLKIMNNITKTSLNSDKKTIDDSKKSFNIQAFEDKLIESINNERTSIDVYSVKKNEKLSKTSQSLLTDIYNKVYAKGTYKSYFNDTFEYQAVYYEEAFDINNYANEKKAAYGLLAYEKENFSTKWLDEKFQYFAVSISDNSDGTYCIVFCLAGDKTITIKNENYSRNLTELDLSGKGLTPADITDIPYMYNLETLKLDNNAITRTDIFGKLPKLKVLRLDSNGISSLYFLKNCEKLESLELRHNNISDLSPLAEITSLKELYLMDNNINDLNSINSLVNLEVVDFDENVIGQNDIAEWLNSMPNKPCQIQNPKCII